MKKVKLTEANAPLKDYVERLDGNSLIVTKKGKPLIALVPIRGVDLESLSVHTDPEFIALGERMKAQRANEQPLSADEMWRHLGIEK